MLTVLNLHTNSLSGEIPDLSGASMLEELYLPNNDLTGEHPGMAQRLDEPDGALALGQQLDGRHTRPERLTSLDKLKLANNDAYGRRNNAVTCCHRT